MGKNVDLPFKPGQMAEAKSFLEGYRGAWFRCKIKKIQERRGDIWHMMEYFDFPDEEIKWTKLYQVGKWRDVNRTKHLMVRPRYPTLYKKKDLPRKITEVTVLTDGVFEIGDLVDWLANDCYWSAVVTQILSKDMFTIELPQPPLGEGLTYEADAKDLRPSLDWSPEFGWKVPSSKGSKTGRTCASLIQPGESVSEDLVDSVSKDSMDFDGTPGSSFPPSLSSRVSSENPKRNDNPKQNTTISSAAAAAAAPPLEPCTNLRPAEHATKMTTMADSASSSHVSSKNPKRNDNSKQNTTFSSAATVPLPIEPCTNLRTAEHATKKTTVADSASSSHFSSKNPKRNDNSKQNTTISSAAAAAAAPPLEPCTNLRPAEHATKKTTMADSASSSHVSSKNPKRNDNSKQNTTISSSAASAPPLEPCTNLRTAEHATKKTSMVDSASSSHVPAETVLNTAEEESSGSLKRSREENYIMPVNSARLDSVEAAIFDLEEIVNKVKWLKNVLEFGLPLPACVKPGWKFVEHRPCGPYLMPK